MESRRAKRLLGSIRKILWENWDPIGCGVPDYEYDSYAPAVLRLLASGADHVKLAAHLKRVAEESMSCPISDEKAARVAAKLLMLSEGDET